MSSPSRRPSPAVYRRRRLVVIVVALLVVAGVVALAVWQPWRTLAPPAASPSVSPVVTSPAPTPSASTPSPAVTPTPTPSDAVVAACSTSDITVLAVTDKDAYGAGELPQLSMTLSNESDAACLINVGTATQAFVITSGSDTWWRSTDCQTESSDQVVQLESGQTVASVVPLAWDRSRSSVDTCDGDRPQAPAGTFRLAVSIGGITAADTRRFELR